ncbi:MAG: matrixin family metalloprotease [Nocardioidaceae bacterium]
MVVAPALLALSAGTLVAANADDPTSVGGVAEQARKSRGYKFLSKEAGYSYIARWNPCAKIHYKINARNAPRKGAIADTRKAIRRVHAASGLKFKYQGKTRMVPKDKSGKPYRGKTDLVIAYTSPKKRSSLKGLAGWGGGYWRQVNKRYAKFTKGFVLLNSKYRYNYPKGFGTGPRNGHGTRGQLLMHELGHAVGLTHVQQKRQIMYPYTLPKKARWGGGDETGLRKVGRPAGCLGGKAIKGAPARTVSPEDVQEQNHVTPAGRE